MKALKTLIAAGAVVAGHAHAQSSEYTTFIRQSQQTSGVTWDLPFTALTGSAASPLSLETNGALYQLYAVKNTGTSYLLDQKLVGAYLPTAVVNIVTEDPYPLVKRTRADRPFTSQITVSGLVTGTTTSGGNAVPEAAKKVLVQRYTTAYPGSSTGLLTGVLTLATATLGTPKTTSYVSSNGLTNTLYSITGILPVSGQQSTKVSGEEYFLVHALADSTIPQTQIASGYVQIHPVASGSITGLATGDVIRFKAPNIQLVLKDLYPRSDTWLQAYKGAAVLGSSGTVVPGSMLVLDQERAESRTLTITDWDSTFPTDGTYTLELLTKTVFGTERLAYITVNVSRTLNVQGTLVGFGN